MEKILGIGQERGDIGNVSFSSLLIPIETFKEDPRCGTPTYGIHVLAATSTRFYVDGFLLSFERATSRGVTMAGLPFFNARVLSIATEIVGESVWILGIHRLF